MDPIPDGMMQTLVTAIVFCIIMTILAVRECIKDARRKKNRKHKS